MAMPLIKQILNRLLNIENSINELEKGEIYSTEEQVIGRWIDGKPLYKKVIVYTPTKIIGETEKVTNIYIAHGISNFKQLCHQKCISSDGYTLPFLGSNTGSNIDNSTQIVQVAPDTICLRIINDTWGVRTWYITLEYTKTTD